MYIVSDRLFRSELVYIFSPLLGYNYVLNRQKRYFLCFNDINADVTGSTLIIVAVTF
jgi:hypothetical protein